MGCKNLPPIFYKATETVADLANTALICNTSAVLHRMDDMVEAIFREEPTALQPELAGLTRYPYLRRANVKPAAYVDVSVNDSLGIYQGTAHQWRRIWKTLFHYLDKVLWPCDSGNSANRKKVLLLKKHIADNCTCST